MTGPAGKKAIAALSTSAVRSIVVGVVCAYAFKVSVADVQAQRIKDYYGADYGKIPPVDISK
eukprot:CAMPEP_0116889676 /NCGR_PEP_ID=MMETSP0467-20121206/213_1 /TAXON_ID=283647 /ORGANISM="Mesodinium pulex, Strain SPMC105" /LENGTH=61 /DNA_ID=CAMNT_0004556671 /DNA_START=40 /DNA_END=225 /DNA_ORIENTATION=-